MDGSVKVTIGPKVPTLTVDPTWRPRVVTHALMPPGTFYLATPEQVERIVDGLDQLEEGLVDGGCA